MLRKCPKVAALLLKTSEVDVNARSKSEMTPLHYASLCGRPKTVALLLDKSGVDVAALDRDGKIALDLAVKRHNTECAELLRGAIADGTSE